MIEFVTDNEILSFGSMGVSKLNKASPMAVREAEGTAFSTAAFVLINLSFGLFAGGSVGVSCRLDGGMAKDGIPGLLTSSGLLSNPIAKVLIVSVCCIRGCLMLLTIVLARALGLGLLARGIVGMTVN